jgi:hypothetical protein
LLQKEIGKKEAVFWIALGVFVCFLGWRIKIGTFHGPGPGFFALIAGLALIVIGTLMLSAKRTKGAGAGKGSTEQTGLIARFFKPRLISTMAVLVGYGVFLSSLGYILCTFFVMTALFFDWGKNRLLTACTASAATTVVTYLVFETWLRTQLPRGILPWW